MSRVGRIALRASGVIIIVSYGLDAVLFVGAALGMNNPPDRGLLTQAVAFAVTASTGLLFFEVARWEFGR